MHPSLAHTAHRPYPLPARGWSLAMDWRDLLFAHWPVDPQLLRPHIPAALEIDTFDGAAWIGVVPFFMSGVRPRFVPEAFGLAFPELNVRTYVTHHADNRSYHGVWFFSLDCTSRLTVWGARTFFHLPYFLAEMETQRMDSMKQTNSTNENPRIGSLPLPLRERAGVRGSSTGFDARPSNATIQYHSRRRDNSESSPELSIHYQPTGEIFHAASGTLEHFLAERYCLFCTNRHNCLARCDTHHPPWPLQPARAEIETSTMLAPLGLPPPTAAPILHFAKELNVVAWTLEWV